MDLERIDFQHSSLRMQSFLPTNYNSAAQVTLLSRLSCALVDLLSAQEQLYLHVINDTSSAASCPRCEGNHTQVSVVVLLILNSSRHRLSTELFSLLSTHYQHCDHF